MMQKRNTLKLRLVATFCLLLFCLLLLVSACGDYSSPGSPPRATPTKSGYSLISLLDNEIEVFLAPYSR